MKYTILAHFVFLFVNVQDLLATVSWNTESVTANQGDAVNLTCTVSDVDFMDVIRVSFKNTNDQVLTIADNGDMKLPFSNIPHYRVNFQIVNNQRRITIFYDGIRGEDMGSLTCRKLANEEDSAEAKIHVHVPVKEIYLRQRILYQMKKVEEMDVVTFREMEDNHLECVAVVDGGLTPIDMRVFIGNEDKTQFFTASEESNVVKHQDGELGQYYSEFKLTYSSMFPQREFNGHRLTCTAFQEGFNNVSASALLRVEYGPVIICGKYQHYGRMGRGVKFICEVTADPACDDITWMMDAADKSGTITLASDNFGIKLSETVIDSSRKQLQLTIERVEQMHFTHYHLSAANSVSANEVSILLLPASIELDKLPSKEEQMLYFLKQQMPDAQMMEQQMPVAELAVASGTSRIAAVLASTLFLILLPLFW